MTIETAHAATPAHRLLLGDADGVGPEMGVEAARPRRNVAAADVLLIADPVVLAAGERVAGVRR